MKNENEVRLMTIIRLRMIVRMMKIRMRMIMKRMRAGIKRM